MFTSSIKFATSSDYSVSPNGISSQLNFLCNYKNKKDGSFLTKFQEFRLSVVPYVCKPLVLLFDDEPTSVDFNRLISALFEAEVDIYAATYTDFKKSVVGMKKKKFKYLGTGQSLLFDCPSEELMSEALFIKANDLSSVFTGFFCSQLNDLSQPKLVEMAFLLASQGLKTPIGVTVESTSLTVSDANRGVTVNFSTGIVGILENANAYLVHDLMDVGGFQVSGSVILALLCMEFGALTLSNSGYKLKGIISSLTSLWDEDFVYGVDKDPTDPGYLMKSACAHQLSATFDSDMRSSVDFPLPLGILYSGEFDLFRAQALVDGGEAIVTDKTGKQFAGGNLPAAAAGICRKMLKGFGIYSDKEYDVQITPHDIGSKLSKDGLIVHLGAKTTNRVTQGMKHNKANQYTDNLFNKSSRTDSAYSNRLPNGKLASQKGLKVKIAATDMGVNFGSGGIPINPDDEFNVGIKKTKKGRIAVNMLSDEKAELFEIGTAKGFNAFLSSVKEVVSNISKDKIFAPGEAILSYDFGAKHPKIVILNDSHNQFMRLTGEVEFIVPAVQGNYHPAYFNVSLGVETLSTTKYAKLRNIGRKATTHVNRSIKFFDDFGVETGYPATLVFNLETLKGKAIHLEMFAAANGLVINNNDGTITWYKEDGTEKTWNVLDKYNPIQAWVKANSKKMSMTVDIPQVEWDIMEACGADDHTKVIAQHEGYVTVSTTFNCLIGYAWVEYEISTADESVGVSSFTPEMTAGLYLQFPRLAEAIVKRSLPRRAKVFDLVNMAAKVYDKSKVSVYNTNSIDSALDFTQLLDLDSLVSVSDRDLISLLSQLFPYGVVFSSSSQYTSSELFIDFKVVGHSMTFISGSADQISQEIVSLIRWLTTSKNHKKVDFVSIWNSIVNKLSVGLSEWLFGALMSKGLMKNAARSADFIVNGKVRNTYDIELQPDADGIPKTMINPGCGMAKLLAKDENGKFCKEYVRVISNTEYIENNNELPEFCQLLGKVTNGYVVFDPYLLHGKFVGGVRVPMYMMVGCKLVISTKHEKSYAAILPSVWAMTNHGDGDGDGIGLINLSSFDVTVEEIITMNKSICGMAAYAKLFGPNKKNWPYADFVERPKKKLIVWETQEDEDEYLMPYFSAVPLETVTDFPFPFHEPKALVTHVGYLPNLKLVQQHYKSAVGIGYGIASALTFMATNMVTTGDKKAEWYKFALSIMWALVYEGLGLSGYTPEAKNWFDVLKAAAPTATNAKQFGKYATAANGIIISVYDDSVASNNLSVSNAVETLGSQFKMDHMPKVLVDWAIAKILEVENIRRHVSKIERGTLDFSKAKAEVVPAAMVYGALRRLGQGKDPAGQTHDANIDEQGGNSGMSLFQTLGKYEYHHAEIKTPWLLAMLNEGVELHTLAGNFLKTRNEIKEANN